jgi:hypothetical protein
MKTKVYYQPIKLIDGQLAEFDKEQFFANCPDGYQPMRETFRYYFTDTLLVLSVELMPTQS